ncbi:MAG: undecaprenyl-diphosphate phosphatase [Saprospiraceae bacterium]|nr:undecaprenyl-diphosphate phosphatase [Saprospiraceae bacterium]
MTYLQAIIIAIVEGLTEFLPVSSTGHMVITSSLMGIQGDEFTKLFEVVIQFGAILSVVILYWKRFFQSFDFYLKLLAGFMPAALFGVLLYKHIKDLLESPTFIAVMLVIGGVILLFVDDWFEKNESPTEEPEQEMTYKKAAIIGCFQVLAMGLPGLSRSAATIIGGLTQKFTRQKAAEFSFFLAVPTMAAATLKDGYEFYKGVASNVIPPLSTEQISILIVGNIVAFIVAFLAIRSFIGFLTARGFKVFGYYRIVVGLLILALQAAGISLFVN